MKKWAALVLLLGVFVISGCGTGNEQKGVGKNDLAEVQPQAVAYVKGYVQKPGTYTVAPGTAVAEIVRLAGGLLPEADAGKVDQAAGVYGVVELYIPRQGEVPPPTLRDGGNGEQIKPTSGYERPQQRAKPPAAAPVYRPALSISGQEQHMLDLINRERASRGIAPLSPDPLLSRAARAKSQDMLENNYFAHESPRYGVPSAMLAAFGVTYHYAGENIAIDANVESGHKNLMGSPGHRQAILNPKFTRVGIGVVQSPQGLIISQEFAD